MVSKQMFGEDVQFVFSLEVHFPFVLRNVPEQLTSRMRLSSPTHGPWIERDGGDRQTWA